MNLFKMGRNCASILATGVFLTACGGGDSDSGSAVRDGATSSSTCTATVSTVTAYDLGTSAPPTTLGGYTVQAFDQTEQAAITNGTSVTTIPGNPLSGSLTLATALDKHAIGSGWSTWSHSYTGVVYGLYTSSTSNTLTLPTGTTAFYFYLEPDTFSTFAITATSDSGATVGAVDVAGSAGANGFGFAAPCGSTLSSITFTVPSGANGYAIGEFGIAQ